MEPGKVTIHAVDYVIFVVMLLGTLAIGVYHACTGGKQKTTSEYLTGDRNLSFFPVSVSLTASFFSSILMLGFPAEAYTNGGMYWLYAVGIAIGAILSATLFVPVFHPLKLTSVNESVFSVVPVQYLYRRFDSRLVAVLGSLSNVTGMVLYTSIVYFAPATAVKVATGFPTWASIIIGSIITIIYTSIGGIKAVIWTDVFQAVLMLIGLLTISIHAVNQVGGIDKVWEIAGNGGRLNIIDLNPDPTQRFTFWSLTIGVGFFDMNRYGTQQTAVQRYCSLSSMKKAIICVLCLVPFTAVMTFIASLTGVVIYSYYAREGCDPLAGKFIDNANQLVPHFVQVTLNYPGVQGILLASLVSASLSTASSALNSSAANLWKDIINPIWPGLSETKNVVITKVLVVVFGVVSTALAFALIGIGGTVVQMIVTFFSACGGPTTAMFLLGIFFSFTNAIGAATGGVVGFIFAMWMGFGSYSINRQRDYLATTTEHCDAYAIRIYGNLTTTTTPLPSTVSSVLIPTVQPDENPLHKLYSVSYLWIACFSMTIAFVVGFLVSLISGRMRGKTVSPELYHPWVRRFYCPDYHKDHDKMVQPTENGIEKSYHNDNFLSSENGTVNGLKQEENGNGEKADNNRNDIVVTQL